MKKKPKLKRWTSADLKQLRTLAKAKRPASAIAKVLKRSIGAVSQKALRHGIRFRSSRLRKKGRNAP
jgi:hypothetical protein